jgi:hypothetical protein
VAIRKLEDELTSVQLDPLVEPLADVGTRLRDRRKRLASIRASIQSKIAALGISDRINLQRISGSKFLELQVNGRALKFRLRQRVRERRFEKERIDQLYRNVMNGTSWPIQHDDVPHIHL